MNGLEIKWFLTALLGGASCGLAGFLLISLNLPFMGVCLAHAALAGAVIGILTGIPPLAAAFMASLLAAGLLGPVADKTKAHANTVMSILFSLTLGLAFLGIGLMKNNRSEAMGLMWGSLLLVRWIDLVPLALTFLLMAVFLTVLQKEVKAVLFDREIAQSAGLHAALIYYLIITFCGITVTVNLNVVGGLMLYSLLTNPAASATQITGRFVPAMVLSAVLAVLSAVGGLCISLWLGWPAGASIVIISCLIFSGASGWRMFQDTVRAKRHA